MFHFHVKRAVFVVFLIGVLGLALVRYEQPERLLALGRQLIPVPPSTTTPSGAAPPLVMPSPEPVGPNSEAPLFTVDIEQIPQGMTARGTSFPLGDGLWLTARHVANTGCDQIIMIIDSRNVRAEIKYLDPNADLAVLQAPARISKALPIENAAVKGDESAFAFGFPRGILGGTEGRLMGRARMRLGGRLVGTAPVLTWAELQRYPDSLDSLAGISGGPMLDENGNVVGIIVAASVRRGRFYTVAPQILHAVERELQLRRFADEVPARDALRQPVSLDSAASALSSDARIVETYCIPPSS